MLNLKKRKLKTLSQDAAIIPSKMTKQIGGAHVSVSSDTYTTTHPDAYKLTDKATIIQTGPTDPATGPFTGTLTGPSTITGPGTSGPSIYI
ncbi:MULTISPECIES: hypothetical protein [Pseudoalteromonas]|uniref:Uncharacterized protein n=1 Tax=Pseudoalteromonas luteoviolacea (strain 2ta16) TaxID=1353533 RepID=V4HZK5_PSEL2|nr:MULTISPECIES: hypothetical protein [Pseudoalteromonas]ESP95248.1 hypothetical protein PL2TA16_03762 [Pseudoalteromonas luteoviolacea 2ta16]KZN37838.1 hypothetical protein N483_21110 [Pseudoalteromonas luteoviolacea NCIMB 1944]MCG7551491.1 hypothetical protein [Pseudoalteromonas sp. Of7M-16]